MMEILIKLDKRLYKNAKHHTLTSSEIDEICDAIANGTPLPKGQRTEIEWILVSERLPEDEQEILFSAKRGGVHSGKYHDDDSANQWYSHMNKCRVWNNVVTAWMPLPQLYNAESEG